MSTSDPMHRTGPGLPPHPDVDVRAWLKTGQKVRLRRNAIGPCHGPSTRRLTGHLLSACSAPRSPPESTTSTRPSTTARNVVNDLIREALYPYPRELAIVSKMQAPSGRRDGHPPRRRTPVARRHRRQSPQPAARPSWPRSTSACPAPAAPARASMISWPPWSQARDEGLIAGVGLSNVSHERLPARRGRHRDRLRAEPVPPRRPRLNPGPGGVHPPRHRLHAVLPARLAARRSQPGAHQPGGYPDSRPPWRLTPPQVALQWLLQLAPNMLLIPGTGSTGHLLENLAAEHVALDDEALRDLATSAHDEIVVDVPTKRWLPRRPARFPGSTPVIGHGLSTGTASAPAGEGLPSSRRHHLNVPRPLRRGVPRGCASRISPLPWHHREQPGSALPQCLTTRQASLHAADHSVASPKGLSTLGSALARFQTRTPACYRASWQLPGPDFHRQATTSFRSGHDRWTITSCSLGAPAAVLVQRDVGPTFPFPDC